MNNTDQIPYVMKPKHIAAYLGVSIPTAYEYMKRADFPTIKLAEGNGAVRAKRVDVDQWLENQKVNKNSA